MDNFDTPMNQIKFLTELKVLEILLLHVKTSKLNYCYYRLRILSLHPEGQRLLQTAKQIVTLQAQRNIWNRSILCQSMQLRENTEHRY